MTNRWSIAAWAGVVAAAMAVVGLNMAHAADIKVLAANAAKGPFGELIPAFEKASGHKVVMVWGGTEAIAKKISDSEVVDVVIIAAPSVDKLIAEGKLVADGRANFAKSGVGMAVRSGLSKPEITSVDAVKRAVLAAQSVAYSTGPTGFYIADMFKKMGISDQGQGQATCVGRSNRRNVGARGGRSRLPAGQ
jgi:molybdate transport system substrate-binding protein